VEKSKGLMHSDLEGGGEKGELMQSDLECMGRGGERGGAHAI
jgi:hypothetical protein